MQEDTPLLNNSIKRKSSQFFCPSTSTPIITHNSSEELIKYASDVSTEEISQIPQVPIIKGIRDMFLSCFAFSTLYLTMKILILDGYSVPQLLIWRCSVIFIISSIYAYYAKVQGGPFGPKEDRIWLHCRGTFGAINVVTFFLSLQHLDLGDALALSFIVPVIMPIISYLWIGEDYTCLDAGAAFIAMVGVVFISKPEFLFGSDGPDSVSNGLGLFYALVAGVTGAFSNISIRKISKKSNSIHIVIYIMLWTLPVCFAMVATSPEGIKLDFNYLQIFEHILVATLSFLGHFWLARSLLSTPARFVSPILFTEVFFAYITQWLVWEIPPTSNSTIGVMLVAFSLLILNFKI
jgi:drug/metabolite transporter (DMT)-like permease